MIMDDRQPVSLFRRALSYLICGLIATQPLLPAFADQITPVTPGTKIDAAGNGVPVVNIATPNQAGVSHNQYQQYNVGKEGLILNNATGQLTQTQLGGLIQNNPNLKAGQEAQSIINEVVGANRSQLQGYTEVAGKAANVIVANPYGITCNGCGFINTPNATLTTGKPQLDANGNLASLEVTKGSVIVEGQGLDGSSADAVSIVARATEINAGIYAKDLTVTVGANRVGKEGSITPIAGEGAAPSVAVDTSALGGMYANRIHLVSSEKGVGVNLGNLNARQGDMVLDAQGKLTLNNSLSSGSLTANASSVTLSGDNKASGQVTVNAVQDIALEKGTLVSDAGIQLRAQNRFDNSGQITASKNLSATAQQLNNKGMLAGATATVVATDLQNSNGAAISAVNSLAINSNSLVNLGVFSAPVLSLSSAEIDNSGLIQGSQSFGITGSRLTNLAGGTLSSDNSFALNLPELNNSGLITSGATLSLSGNNLTNQGEINAADIAAHNAIFNNQQAGLILADNTLSLQNNSLANAGQIAAEKLDIDTAQVANTGTLQGTGSLQTQGKQLTNSGTLLSGGEMTVAADKLDNQGLLQGQQLTLTSRSTDNSGRLMAQVLTLQGDLINSGLMQGTKILALRGGDVSNKRGGQLLSGGTLNVQGNALDNQGSVEADQLNITAQQVNNTGLLQADNALVLNSREVTNSADGVLLSGGDLTLTGSTFNNAGVWQGQGLTYQLDSLLNTGTVDGKAALTGTSSTLLDNRGSLLTGGEAKITAVRLLNSGKIMAASLQLRGGSLSNSGLWQGASSLDAQATNDLTQTSTGKALSAGDLLLNASNLSTAGTLQGANAHITANSWWHQGSLLGTDGMSAAIDGELRNDGELLSEGTAQFSAQNLLNNGSLLAEKAMTLNGGALNNTGTVQGETLDITPASVTNQGCLIGLQSLTIGPLQQRSALRMRIAQATPSRVLVNNAGGKLLTQGTLALTGDTVTNNGTWQGQQILLDANSLTNGGAIQSADGLQITLRDNLTSTAGSKISANGSAALNALNFTNQGQWIAKNLTLQGGTLNNNGDISGVDALSVQLSGALTQQQNKTLLSAGKLDLHSASLSNAGQIQGQTLEVTTGGVNNGGRIQGDNNLAITASGRMTNNASGTLLSKSGLTLTTPELYNYGLIQGGSTRITANNTANNSGKVLSAGELTFNTPQLTNSGWLQAAQLTLNAANASNSGTLLADQQGTLTGSQLQNQGMAQGGNLAVNYAQLNNSGTVLGVDQLTVNATQVTHQASGRLFSGGSLLLKSTGFDQLGQVVALGDATLQLINGFTGRNTLAAGNRLSISSNGAIENQSQMQGQAVTLSAGGDLTNNGQITTGTGDSSLSGNRINLNGAGSLQGGGNLALTSRSDVVVNGFTGTLGNLTINSPGSIINTALLYAGQNLYLYGNSIQNERGDMLAGNSLWLQRDAAGNANGEVNNTSGTIESQKGDITIKTGHLLNTRDGLNVSQTTQSTPVRAGVGDLILKININELPEGSYGYYTVKRTTESGGGCAGADGGCSTHTTTKNYYAPYTEALIQRFALTSSTVSVVSNGGAGRISSGRDLSVQAGRFENQASTLLANRNISLSGDQFNNQSWQAGTQNNYAVYEYKGGKPTTSVPAPVRGHVYLDTESNDIAYSLTGQETSFIPGELYRAVIQAGGSINASFSGDISNTSTTANAGWSGNTLAAPALSGLSGINKTTSLPRQQLTGSENVTINSPEWRDQLQNALQQVNGGTPLVDRSEATKNLTDAEKAQNAGSGTSVLPASLHHYAAANVDTSAYPLPSSENGYFVTGDSKSPYLITLNPKLNGLGQLDSSLFGDLNALLGKQPGSALQETRQQYTDVNTFLGSAYLLDRLNLKPDNDYRFLGDAAFDTRYVSNVVLSQTGSRYLNGVGSDLDQMRYLMDNAAAEDQSLGLQFGVSLTADQIASLDKSIIWWEAATVNGETVMVPKVYLSSKDAAMNNGSVLAGNNISLSGGNVINSGSTLTAQNALSLDSQNRLDNLSSGLIKAGGDLQLTALSDINNVSSTISGKKVALESINGDINNITTSQLSNLNASNNGAARTFTETLSGPIATITAGDSLGLKSGNDINITGAKLSAGGNLGIDAGHNVAVNSNQVVAADAQSGFKNGWQKITATSDSTTSNQGSEIIAGGNVALQAGHDLQLTASSVSAGNNTVLAAGNDISLNTAATEQNTTQGKNETHSTGVDRTSLTSGGDLTINAGRDLTSQAAALAAEGDIGLQAGRDINLEAKATTSGNSERGSKKTVINETVRQQGTEITGKGSTSLSAGRDITSRASEITADENLSLKAGRDVNITTATESDYAFREETKTSKGFLSKKTTHTVQENSASNEKASQLSGKNVSVNAGNDLTLEGSSIAGDTGVALSAGHDFNLLAAADTQSTYSLKEVKKSGLSSGGMGISYGKQSAKSEYNGAKVTQSDARSLVGTVNGAVTITAGNNALIKGSDVVAGGNNGDINVTAKNIAVLSGQDQVRESYKQESKSSGMGLQLTGTLIDTVRNLRDAMNQNSSVFAQAKAVGNEFGASAMDAPDVGMTYHRSSSKASQTSESVYQSGSSLTGGGNVSLTARGEAGNGNILVAGSSVSAGKAAALQATGNIDVVTEADSQRMTSDSRSKQKDFTSTVSAGAMARMVGDSPNNGAPASPIGLGREQQKSDATYLTQHTSSITGNSVSLNSDKGDITVSGSTLTGKQSVSLTANQGSVSLNTGEDRQNVTARGSITTIGSLGGDGYSGTIGWGSSAWNKANTGSQQNNLRSGVVSEQGNVSISAGKDVTLQGADVYAGNRLDIDGQNIQLTTSQDSSKASSASKSAQYGVTVQMSGYGVSVAQAADKAVDAHKNNSDPRLQAIYAAQAAMTALSAVTQKTAAVKVTVSATAGSSHQSMEQSNTEQTGTTLKSGGDTTLTAKENIIGVGASISGDNIALSAGKDIALRSSEDTRTQKSSSGGSNYGVGVGFGLGGSQNGFSIELAASQSSGKMDGNSVTHNNSEVTATGDLTVKAGQDVTLNGANLSGEHVELNAGRNLEIASQQDHASYDSHESSSGFNASICVPPICAGVPVQGSANVSGSKIYNDYASVNQQSGISAGEGGYTIYVGDHTQLDGAVIASTATPDKNHLSTGTLGWTDIHNHASSGGNGFGVGVSDSSLPVATLGQNKDRAGSTTYSAISPGTIEIRNPDDQQQDVSQLSRDTASAENALKDGFDAEKVQNSLTVQREMAALAQQVITQTFDYLKEQEKQEQKKKLENDSEFNKLTDVEKEKVLDKAAEDKYGIGSKMQIAAQAISGVFAGLAGGNVGGAVAAGAAPLLAQMVKQVSQDNEPLRILLHTLASGLIAKAQGGSVAGGAAGGLTAGLMGYNDALSKLLFGREPSELSADEKMLIANIVTLAGAATGGAVDGSAGIGSGASAGRTEVENNYLSDKDIITFTEKYAKAKTDAEKEQLVSDLKKLDADKQKQALSTGISIADQKTELGKLKQLVASPDCTDQCRELANYSISQLEPVVNNTQLHKDNLTKAVLASTIITLTLEQSGKIGEKAPATGMTSAGKSTSAIDDIVKGEGQAAKGTTGSPTGQQTKLNPEIETKILAGQRIDGSNKIIGGHSPNINDANPKYAVETIKVNADGTRTVKYTTQFEDGKLSKIKTSTLFPEGWSDKIIIDSINKIGNAPAIGQRATTGETLHRGSVNGVEIDVIKKGNEITAGYPVGGKPTPGFNPIK
jgi:filamentous hemagglutinin